VFRKNITAAFILIFAGIALTTLGLIAQYKLHTEVISSEIYSTSYLLYKLPCTGKYFEIFSNCYCKLFHVFAPREA
jgi:hypothetical protein